MPHCANWCASGRATDANIAGCGKSTRPSCCKSNISSPATWRRRRVVQPRFGLRSLHKGSDLTGIDPETKQIVEIFNPRTAPWHEHFRLQEVEIVGRSACGRATVSLLQMNA